MKFDADTFGEIITMLMRGVPTGIIARRYNVPEVEIVRIKERNRL